MDLLAGDPALDRDEGAFLHEDTAFPDHLQRVLERVGGHVGEEAKPPGVDPEDRGLAAVHAAHDAEDGPVSAEDEEEVDGLREVGQGARRGGLRQGVVAGVGVDQDLGPVAGEPSRGVLHELGRGGFSGVGHEADPSDAFRQFFQAGREILCCRPDPATVIRSGRTSAAPAPSPRKRAVRR